MMANAPDSILMTAKSGGFARGHMGPEVAAGDLLVTAGGVQKRLADLLAPELNPTVTTLKVTGLPNAAKWRSHLRALTDLAAKAAGVPIGGLYRTGNAVMVRLV